jgi:hypothetical protein
MDVIQQLHYKTQQGLMFHTLILTCNSPNSPFCGSCSGLAIIRLLLLSRLYSTPYTISANHKLVTTHITGCYMNNAFLTLTPEWPKSGNKDNRDNRVSSARHEKRNELCNPQQTLPPKLRTCEHVTLRLHPLSPEHWWTKRPFTTPYIHQSEHYIHDLWWTLRWLCSCYCS